MCNRTEVVNIKIYKKKDFFYIGRGSVYGNQFRIGIDGTREEVVERYRKWFYDKLEDPVFKTKVLSLRGKKIGCYCKPKACHGDVIKEYLDGIFSLCLCEGL